MKKTSVFVFTLFAVILLTLSACGGGGGSNQASQATPLPTPPPEYAGKTNPLAGNADAIAAGETVFQTNCVPCHGKDARGDGPAAASLNPKPADLRDLQKDMSDAYMFWRISAGGAMPPFNSAMPSWAGTLSEEQIWQAISYIRSLS